MVTYSAQETVPSLEDFGNAQLVNGVAYARLAGDFANAIDGRSTYSVFITPEGPSTGLYVAIKTAGGFTVRENPGGHSTIGFNYCILAQPFGGTSSRASSPSYE